MADDTLYDEMLSHIRVYVRNERFAKDLANILWKLLVEDTH